MTMNLNQINAFFKTLMLNLELAFRLIFDTNVPLMNKLLFVVITLAYTIMPLDILPDFLPAIGQVDDLAILIFMMLQFIGSCPEGVVEYHKQNIMEGNWRIGLFKLLSGDK